MPAMPQPGFVYKFGDDHYTVDRVEPGMFVLQDGGVWVDAISVIDTLVSRQTRVMSLASFQALEASGEITLPPPYVPPDPPPAFDTTVVDLADQPAAQPAKKERKK